MSAEAESSSPKPRRRWLALLPLAIFLGLAGLFLAQLISGRDIASVPSALIGQPAPATNLPPLEGAGVPGIDPDQFAGKITLVNVWASWCGPCRDEHPNLLTLAQDQRFQIVGLNYKDKPENALAFLRQLGSPYQSIGVDQNGRSAIEWGVYGVPETYLVDRRGIIRYRHVGPLTPESMAQLLMPEVEKVLAAE